MPMASAEPLLTRGLLQCERVQSGARLPLFGCEKNEKEGGRHVLEAALARSRPPERRIAVRPLLP
jgi:hypothetical protein